MNLHQDWNKFLAQKLDLSESQKEGAHYYYFQTVERTIEGVERKFNIPENFVCPPQLRAGLDLLKEYVESGKNLTPFLSKAIERPESIDPLFAQWGIRHFHLGTEIVNGFVLRTGPLAFAKITSEAVYIVKIGNHGEWSNKELIQSAHDNWPYLLEEYKLTFMTNVNASGSQEEIDTSRKQMSSTYIKVDDGTEYIFGEMTVSGHNEKVVMACGHMMRVFAQLESQISKMISKGNACTTFQPKLFISEDTYLVKCEEIGFSYDVTDFLSSEINRSVNLVKSIEA